MNKKTLGIIIALTLVLNPVAAKAAVNTGNDSPKIQQNTIQQKDFKQDVPFKTERVSSTEENFVKKLAESKGISYENAKKLNDANTLETLKGIMNKGTLNGNQIGSSSMIVAPRGGQYSTIYTTEYAYFTINTDCSLVMATEVKYIHDNFNGGNQISSVSDPYMGIDGASLHRWNGQVASKDVSVSTARVSVIGQAYVEVDNSISVGFDLAGLSVSSTTSNSIIYTTKAKTYAMTINAADL